jgi:steroid delta-isomerase-like uncharacterized protein
VTAEVNKGILRRALDVWNSGDLAALDGLFAPGVVMHLRGRPDVTGLDAYRAYLVALRAAFPDQQWLPEDLIAEGDRVVLLWTLRGSHRGELMGTAPTGREVTVTGISAYRVADGKVAEIWVQSDTLGLLQQLGALPAPGQPGS